MPYSVYQTVGLLNLTWGAEAFAAPSSFRLFLSTTDPGVDGTDRTEPVGMGYVQVSITNNTTNWPSVVAASKTNGVDFNFEPASGNWGSIAYAGFDDSDGNFIGSGELTIHRSITSGDILSFPAGSITITMA